MKLAVYLVCSLPVVIRIIQSNTERWAEHVACMGGRRVDTRH